MNSNLLVVNDICRRISILVYPKMEILLSFFMDFLFHPPNKRIMRSLYLLLFLCTCSFSLSAQYWRLVEKSPMPERVSNNAVVEGFIDDVPYVYSFGGIDSTKTRQGIHLRSFRYNVATDVWETIAPLPDTLGKIAAGASRIGDIIYIIGGYHVLQATELSSNRVHRYDIKNNTYLSDGAPIPIPIDDHVQAVWNDSLIYVITGWRGTSSSQGNVPNVQIYNPKNDEWLVGSSTPTSNFFMAFGASGVIIGNEIYYYGGATGGDFSVSSILRKGLINPSNPTAIGWLGESGDPDNMGYRMGATTVEGNPYWLGGSSNTYNYDGIAYDNSGPVPIAKRSLFFDLDSMTWFADTINPLPMDLRGVGEISDTVKYLAGGMLEDQWVSNKTYRLERSFEPVFPMNPNAVLDLNKTQEELSLFPNPNTGRFEVQMEDQLLDGQLEVFASNGQRILEQVVRNQRSVSIDLSRYPV